MKLCSKCKVQKPLAAFNRSTRKQDGLQAACRACQSIARKAHYAANKEKAKADARASYRDRRNEVLASKAAARRADPGAWNRKAREYRERNPEKVRQTSRKWALANRDRVAQSRKAARSKNPEASKARTAEWKANNPGAVLAHNAKRRACLRGRTPLWSDLNLVAEVYAFAKHLEELGLECHVDHIVPLRGRLASGLHVAHNLRVILARDNEGKGNRTTGDEYELVAEIDQPGFKDFIKKRKQR